MRRLLLLLILILLVGCGSGPERTGSAAGLEPVEELEERGAGAEQEETGPTAGNTTILADGQLVAKKPVLPLSFQSNGRLLTIQVEAGEQVSAGDLIATLDDGELKENLKNAELAVAQAEIGLGQAQLALDKLVEWKPDEIAVTAAKSNLAAAEANLEAALSQEAVAGSSLTSARVSLAQAERALVDMQEAYDNAWDEARDWELNYTEPICFTGQGGPIPCTGPTWQERIKNDREATTRGLQGTQDNLAVARANYNLTQAGLGNEGTLNAEASVANALQAVNQAQSGPTESDIAAARLQVAQAELGLEQAEFNLALSQGSLDKAMLVAPWSGMVFAVDSAEGAIVGVGTPIITLMDTAELQFHTSNLSERDLAYIGPGQGAEVVLKSYPSESISGTVAYVVPLASGGIGDAATFTVVIDLEQSQLSLKPGMTGRVDIQREEE